MRLQSFAKQSKSFAYDLARNRDGSLVVALSVVCLLSFIAVPSAKNIEPTLGMWNGFLGQNNVIECLNPSEKDVSARVEISALDGSVLEERFFDIAANGTVHLPILDTLTANQYGTFQVYSSSRIYCATAVYRSAPANSGETLDYAYFLPEVRLIQGVATGLYNSMNPNPVLPPVENWLSLYNPSSEDLELQLQMFTPEGEKRAERSVAVRLFPGERRDLALGHEQGYELGMYRVIPQNSQSSYAASLVRYSKSADGRYNFAFPVHTGEGSCDSGLVPASTMDPAINWGEIANLDNEERKVLIEIFDIEGNTLHEEQKSIAAYSQFHIPLTQFLGPQAVGSFRVRCIEPPQGTSGLLTQSIFYGQSRTEIPEVTWAYAAQGRDASKQNCRYVSAVNTYFNAANWFKIFNRHNGSLDALQELFNADGSNISIENASSISVGSAAGLDSSLHAVAGADFVGLASIRSESRGRVNAGLIRVFPSDTGEISTIMNVPVYEVACGADVAQETAEGCKGVSLKDFAECRGVKFGSPMWEFYDPRMVEIAERESSVITATAYWFSTRPNENTFDFTRTDTQIAFADSLGLPVHGHPLLWADNNFIPGWVKAKPASEAEGLLKDHIRTVATRFRGKVAVWDVINEAANDTGTALRLGYWQSSIGPDYIKMAFETAHAADPDAILLYNDYGLESNEGKFLFTKNLLTELLADGVPIHGIGWQMHVDSRFNDRDTLYRRMQQMSDLGLTNYITELDVRLFENTEQAREDQLRAYQLILQAFLAVDKKAYFQTWGYGDRYTWLNTFIGPNTFPLIWDNDFKEKEIYEVLLQTFLQNPGFEVDPLAGTRRFANPNSANGISYLHQSEAEDGAEAMLLDLNITWGSQKWVLLEEAEGTYRIQCQWGSRYLNAGAAGQSQRAFVSELRQSSGAQLWRVIPTGEDLYLIQNIGTGEYLTGTNWDWGGRVTTEARNQSADQFWYIEPLA